MEADLEALVYEKWGEEQGSCQVNAGRWRPEETVGSADVVTAGSLENCGWVP